MDERVPGAAAVAAAHRREPGLSAPGPVLRDRRYALGIGLVLLAGAFWSLTGILVRNIETASGWQIVCYRSLALTVTLSLVLGARHRGRFVAAFRAVGRTGVIAGLCLSGGFITVIFAMLNTTVANTLFILSATPFCAAVMAWLFLGEPVRGRTWLAMSAALAGVALMVAEGLTGGGLLGNVIALGTMTASAGFAVALRSGRRVDMMPSVCLGAIFSATIAGVMAADLAISLHDLVVCLLLGSVQVGAGLMLFTLGSRHVPAAELALLSLTEVVLGPIWVWLGVGEVPSGLTLLGGAIVLSALAAHALKGLGRARAPL